MPLPPDAERGMARMLPEASLERQEHDDPVEVLKIAFGLAEAQESREREEIGILLRKTGPWAIEPLIAYSGESAGEIRKNAKIILRDLKERAHVAKRLFPDWYQFEDGDASAHGLLSKDAKQQPNKIFVGYSHKDEKWIERLKIHLKPLVQEGLEIWSDHQIAIGSAWDAEIRQAIKAAAGAVLLVSADFFASEYIVPVELPLLLQQAKERGMRIGSLILSESWAFKRSDLAQLQTFNPPSEPLSGMTENEQENTLVRLATRIETWVWPRQSQDGTGSEDR